MKKVIALALVLIFALSLVACGGDSKSNSPSDNGKKNDSQSDSDDNSNSPTDSDNSDNSSSDSDNKDNSPSAPPVSAMTDSKIFVDLVEVQTVIPPQTVDNVIMVPVQAVMETIGYEVNWKSEEQRLEVWEPSNQHPTIILDIGIKTAYYEKHAPELDDCVSYEATLDSPPVLVDGTMIVPLSFISEAIDYTVDDTVDTSDIYLFSPNYMENQIGEGIGETQPETDESGEGIGETQPVTEDEKNYVLSIRTESWLDLEPEQKDEVLSIIARWWDLVDGYVVEDFDSVIADLDHQMETYFRNSVDEGILQTACDIYGLDVTKYIQ